MCARLTAPVGANDFYRILGVSDRTLILAFLERYTIGPMGYYQCLRLHAVRCRLKRNPVIEFATGDFGFHHLGNFTAEFRRLFGDRPSETRR